MVSRYDLERLREIQREIASRVILEDRFRRPIKVITGFDLAFLGGKEAVVAAVSLNYENLQVLERRALRLRVNFPYIPTFLGFREGPPIIRLLRELKVKPDILMLDSHGISHPLLCGCASHVGVLIDKPTIGVAKSRLCGEWNKEPRRVGEWAPITYEGKVVGALLKSRKGSKPIFVSPGHRISLESSIKIVMRCVREHRLPEPIRLAHRLATEERRFSLAGGVNRLFPL